MSTIFDTLQDIVNTKKLPTEDSPYTETNQYMVNRYLSMHSTHACLFVNSTVNSQWKVLTPNEQCKLLSLITPKSNAKRIYIKYIKPDTKSKSDFTSEEMKVIRLMAKQYEISIDEMINYINLYDVKIPEIK